MRTKKLGEHESDSEINRNYCHFSKGLENTLGVLMTREITEMIQTTEILKSV